MLCGKWKVKGTGDLKFHLMQWKIILEVISVRKIDLSISHVTTGNCWKRFLIHHFFSCKSSTTKYFFSISDSPVQQGPVTKIESDGLWRSPESNIKPFERLGTTKGFLNSYSWKQSFPEMCMTQHSVCVCATGKLGLFSCSKNRRPLLTTKKMQCWHQTSRRSTLHEPHT